MKADEIACFIRQCQRGKEGRSHFVERGGIVCALNATSSTADSAHWKSPEVNHRVLELSECLKDTKECVEGIGFFC